MGLFGTLALLTLVVLCAAQLRANDAKTTKKRDDDDDDCDWRNSPVAPVCIVGAGASGMSSAVFLTDNGITPLVFELQSEVGGHCDTYNYKVPKGAQLPGYLDIGVVVYYNTSFPNRAVDGWAIRSDQFASRFDNLLPLSFGSGGSSATYFIDFEADPVIVRESPQPASPSSPGIEAYEAAFTTLYGLSYEYNLRDHLATGERPDPIDPALLLPFSVTVEQYGLTPLLDTIFTGIFIANGFGGLDRITTLEALQALSPAVLDLFVPTNVGAGFAPLGGCQTMYNNMAEYVGHNNIRLSSYIDNIDRESFADKVIINGRQHGRRFQQACSKLIMAIYPVESNLGIITQTPTELGLFSQLSTHYYAALAVNVNGGSLADQAFSIYRFNNTNPFSANGPNFGSITRALPAGPAAAYLLGDQGNSGNGISEQDILKLARDSFRKIPNDLIHSVDIDVIDYHQYDPHFSVAALGASPSADTRFTNLQGQTNTYWVGAATRYDASVVVWNQAYKLVNQFFPPAKK